MKTNNFIGVMMLIIILLVFSFTIIRLLDSFDRYNELNLQLNNLLQENVIWLYTCDGYHQAFYNCPNELKFVNITGRYCNHTIVCKNEYIIKQNPKGK